MKARIEMARIIGKRYEMGLGIKELAGICGLSQATIINMEKRKCEPKPNTVKRVCEALSLNVKEVIRIVA